MSLYAENIAAWLKARWGEALGRSVKYDYREVYLKYPRMVRDLAAYAELYSGTGPAVTEREAAILEGRQQVVRHLIAMGSTHDDEVINFLEDHGPEDYL